MSKQHGRAGGWMMRMAALLAVCALVAPAAAQDSTAVSVDTMLHQEPWITRDSMRAQTDTIFSPYRVDTAAAPVLTTIGESAALVVPAAPLLHEDHWAVRAATRAEAMGLVPGYLPAQRAVPRSAVYAALVAAAAHGQERGGRTAELASGWLARFLEEFPEFDPSAARPLSLPLYGGSAAAGYRRHTGRLAPATGIFEFRQDPRVLPDVSTPLGTALVAGGTGWASAMAEGFAREGAVGLERWDVSAALGDFQVAVGRESIGYGWGHTGGIVYSASEPLPRVEVQTVTPLHLPWVLRRLGPVSVHTFAGPLHDPARHPTNPSLWGMRVAFQPFPRLTFAANRGAMFGGDQDPVDAEKILKMLAGVVHSQFENQVISLEGRWRLPVDRIIPTTAYMEWGADDAAGAMDETPARIIGVFFPALPGAPEVGGGVEYTYFKYGCCGHGTWYFNSTFPGNWAVRDRPLGHPEGGEGSQYAAYAQADLLQSRLRVDARFAINDRADRTLVNFGGGNLFAPQRTGRSTGGRVEAAWRVLPRADVRAGYFRDAGSGWTEQSLHAEVSVLF